MKKLICIFVAALFALGLTACGEKVDTNSSSSQIKIESLPSSVVNTEKPQEQIDTSSAEGKTDKDISSNTASHTHVWGKWIHDKFPNTETGELGSSHRTCKICKEVETKELTPEEVHHMFTTDGLIYLQ